MVTKNTVTLNWQSIFQRDILATFGKYDSKAVEHMDGPPDCFWRSAQTQTHLTTSCGLFLMETGR